jgi:hypothetical protein
MKYSHEFATLILWAIAILATFFIVQDQNFLTYLGPLYFVCMVGSIIVVRKARKRGIM